MGRRKTKNKWSYEHYTVLHQLGPDILTYEIQAEGALTHIVHRNRLFLLLPRREMTCQVKSENLVHWCHTVIIQAPISVLHVDSNYIQDPMQDAGLLELPLGVALQNV